MNRNGTRLASCSNQGPRHRNDDSAFAATVMNGGGERVDLICVADGVGGSSRGDLASRIAVQGVREFVESSRFQSLLELKSRLPDFLNGLSAKIAQSVDSGQTANTTLTVCLVFGGESLFIHSGDSMLGTCMVEKTDFTTLTDVHSCKSDCVNENGDEDAGQGISANAISAGLGSGFTSVRYQVGENFLIPDAKCWIVAMTDGVHGVVSRAAMVKLCASAETPEVLAQRLVQAALDAGTRDNATAAVYRAGPLRRPRHFAKAAALSGAVVVGGMALLWQGVHAGSRVDPVPPQKPVQASTAQVVSTLKMKLDEALASARKAKDEEHWAECLEYAHAALMLVPDHAEALALKREAAEAARLAEEKRKEDEAAEAARLAAEKRKADEAAEKARLAEENWEKAKKEYQSSGKDWVDVEDICHVFCTEADAMKETGIVPSDFVWLIKEVKAVGFDRIESARKIGDEGTVNKRQKNLDDMLEKIKKVQGAFVEKTRQAEGR